jgi:hypothetical protein
MEWKKTFSWIVCALMAATALAAAAGNANAGDVGQTDAAANVQEDRLLATEWVKRGMVLDATGFSIGVQYPYVIRDGGIYKMWYAGLNAGPSGNIYYATSSDGLAWSPYGMVLSKPSGTNYAAAPCVLKEPDGTYKMWYSCQISTSPWNSQVYYATSADGISWTPYGLVLPIGPAGSFDSLYACLGYVFNEDGQYKMYYKAYDASSVARFGYATSADGIAWTKHGAVMDLPTGYTNMECPFVARTGSTYSMWFNAYQSGTGRILAASSANGTSWTVDGVELSATPGGLDSNAIYTPCVLLDAYGQAVRMYYAGDAGSVSRIFLAENTAIHKPPVADAGPDQAVNEGDAVRFNGSGSSDPVEYWDSFGLGADSWITSAPPASILATFTSGATVYPALVATQYGSGKAVYTEGSVFSEIYNIMQPGNVRHQLFLNSVEWATGGKAPTTCNVLVTWGHRELLTYWDGTPTGMSTNIVSALTDEGYAVTLSHDVPAVLTGYDAVIMVGVGWSYVHWVNGTIWSGPGGTNDAHALTVAETNSLSAFVQNGGGLVASVEESLGASYLNPIGNMMGVTFQFISGQGFTATRIADHPIFVKWGSGEIVSYSWDFDSSDGIQEDATGPTPTHVYGDNGIYTVTLTVTDGDGLSATDTMLVTVSNVAPSANIDGIFCHMEVEMIVSGTPGNMVMLEVEQEGAVIGSVAVTRTTGCPNKVTLDVDIDLTKPYEAKLIFDSPGHKGTNPVWIRAEGGDQKLVKVFHASPCEPSTWHQEYSFDLSQFVFAFDRPLEFRATATDPGSDDLTFTWDFGDGTSAVTTTYYNDGVGPDPYPSPWGEFPFTATDAATHSYSPNHPCCGGGHHQPPATTYTVTLTVEDDDGGMTTATITVTIGHPWHPYPCPHPRPPCPRPPNVGPC